MTPRPRPQVNLRLEYIGAPEMYTHKLRHVLKVLYRTFDFRCIGMNELRPLEVKDDAPTRD